MDNIKQWVVTLSAISIISGVLISLLPKSSHKTLYKSLTAIIMVYAVLQPLTYTKKLQLNIDDYLYENYSISNSLDDYAISSVVDSAETAIENLFIEEAEKLEIDCNFQCSCEEKNNEITVTKLTVTPKLTPEDIEEIYNIAKSLGVNTEVIVFEGE